MALAGAPTPDVAAAAPELSAAKRAAKADLERLLGPDPMNEDTDDESYAEESESEDIEEEVDAPEAAEGEQAAAAESDMESLESEEEEADEEITMEEVVDVVSDAQIPLSYQKDGIFNPTQVLRSGKQVFSELRATTIEKGEFESDDEEDGEYEASDEENDSVADEADAPEAEEAAAEDEETPVDQEDEEDEEEDEEPEFDEPVTAEEFKEIVTDGVDVSAPIKSSKVLRDGREIAVDGVEDLSAKIKEMLAGGLEN
ncbi:hypothetical protein DFJ74DRAFT_767535 [Hyaloraphidium curvatum]|nr:hypothetical protein DFJ74DRAFT_767535 [Hyaloraphidium curvatum]